jgi:hypothetical protein
VGYDREPVIVDIPNISNEVENEDSHSVSSCIVLPNIYRHPFTLYLQ